MAQETLIDTIKSDLSANSSLVTVREAYIPEGKLFLANCINDERMEQIPIESYRFWVAPTNPIAPDNVEGLNRFLDGITGQEPLALKHFSMYRGRLRVGRLHLQETLLTQRVERKVSVFDLEAVKKAGLLSSNLFGDKVRRRAGLRPRSLSEVDDRHFVREIYVFPFPSTELARLHLALDEEVLRRELSLSFYERDEVKIKLYWELHDLLNEVRPGRIKAIKAGQNPFPEISKVPELQEVLGRYLQ